MRKINIKHFLILFILSLLPTIIFLLFIEQPEVEKVGDSYDYIDLAKNIMKGKGYCDETGNFSVARPPLYPFVLSVIFKFFGENNFTTARFANVIFHVITTISVFYLSKYFLPTDLALLSGIVTAINPYHIFNTGFILTESFLTMMITLSFLFLFNLIKVTRYKYVIITGIFWGMLTLTKAVSFLYPFFVCPFLIWRTKKFHFLMWIVIICLTISPWVIRNYKVTGRFLLSDTKGGWVFFTATLPVKRVIEWGELPQQKAIIEEMDQLGIFNPVDRDRYLIKAALKNIKRCPWMYLKLVIFRMIKFVAPYRYWQVLKGYAVIGKYSFLYYIAFFINLLLFFFVIVNFIMFIMNKEKIIYSFIITSGILYHWLVYALISDASPRFSVPLYPLVVVNGLYFLYKIFSNYKNSAEIIFNNEKQKLFNI